jgi:hypothetical protein
VDVLGERPVTRRAAAAALLVSLPAVLRAMPGTPVRSGPTACGRVRTPSRNARPSGAREARICPLTSHDNQPRHVLGGGSQPTDGRGSDRGRTATNPGWEAATASGTLAPTARRGRDE